MQKGTVVEEGTASEILSVPKTDYAKRLVKAIPKIPVSWLSGWI